MKDTSQECTDKQKTFQENAQITKDTLQERAQITKGTL